MRYRYHVLSVSLVAILLGVIGSLAWAVERMKPAWDYLSPSEVIDLSISDDGRIVGFTTEADDSTAQKSTAYVLENGVRKWQYQTGDRLWQLDVSEDGNLVTVSSSGNENSTVSLLQTSSGQVLWQKSFGGSGYLLDQGGFIILLGDVGDSQPTMVVDRQGKVVEELPDSLDVSVSRGGRYFSYWHYKGVALAEVPHKIIHQFRYGTKASISDSGHLVAVVIQKEGDPASVVQLHELGGRLLWSKQVSDISYLEMAGGGSAVLVIRNSRNRYGATTFDAKGNLLWNLELDQEKIVDEAVAADGTLFALAIKRPESRGEVRLYDRTGSELTSRTIPEEVKKVRLTRDGHALVVASKTHIYYFTLLRT